MTHTLLFGAQFRIINRIFIQIDQRKLLDYNDYK